MLGRITNLLLVIMKHLKDGIIFNFLIVFYKQVTTTWFIFFRYYFFVIVLWLKQFSVLIDSDLTFTKYFHTIKIPGRNYIKIWDLLKATYIFICIYKICFFRYAQIFRVTFDNVANSFRCLRTKKYLVR